MAVVCAQGRSSHGEQAGAGARDGVDGDLHARGQEGRADIDIGWALGVHPALSCGANRAPRGRQAGGALLGVALGLQSVLGVGGNRGQVGRQEAGGLGSWRVEGVGGRGGRVAR